MVDSRTSDRTRRVVSVMVVVVSNKHSVSQQNGDGNRYCVSEGSSDFWAGGRTG